MTLQIKTIGRFCREFGNTSTMRLPGVCRAIRYDGKISFFIEP